MALPLMAATDGLAPSAAYDAPLALLACADARSRQSAARWLSSSGFAVAEAADGVRALEILGQLHPAVVIAEMALRDRTGRTICQAVREQADRAHVPVLAVCAGDREVRAALQQGTTDLLRKPFDWQLAAFRAARLTEQARLAAEAERANLEADRLRRALEEERRDRVWLDHADPLTGLPDGGRLERALESALAGATESSQVAVALFDVEHLVLINSRLGRARANSVLQQVAQRLVGGLRSDEVLRSSTGPAMSMAARLGGGLFAAVLTGLPGWQEAKATVRVLLDRLSGRYFAGDEEIVLATSVGVALAPADGNTAEILLQKAELAASEAVDSGGAIRFYGQTSNRVTERTRAIMRLMVGALDRGELELHYQPLVGSKGIFAAEALLRWDSPELGSVTPSEFVPLAEEAGLMVSIGSWCLRTACRQVRTWLDAGLPQTRMSVNVSLCQLVRGDFADVVRDALRESDLPASVLELELSERGVLRSDPEILRQLEEIRTMGAALAIDDFGTGHSAVAYLKQFPVDVLKIDQSFVRGLASSSEDAAITSATIAMARQLGLRVVAEGVEEQRQLEFLRLHGCSEYQGFLFSPAVPAEEFAGLVRRGLEDDKWRHDPCHEEQNNETR